MASKTVNIIAHINKEFKNMNLNQKNVLMYMFLVGFLVTILSTYSLHSYASEITVNDLNKVSVIDGDTIQIGETVYQLAGIDAPELGQACSNGDHLWLCGLAAGYTLSKRLGMLVMPMRCFIQQREKALPIAACMIGDEELSIILLKSGNVTALPDDSPHYAAAEHIAKKGGLGIWGGKFISPWDWRNGERLPNEHQFKGSSHPTDELSWKFLEHRFLNLPKAEHAACMIKGNISVNNERFYFSPLDHNYGSITITTENGERFFCGDDEARDAGWKRFGEAP